jgi:hypothetical protein
MKKYHMFIPLNNTSKGFLTSINITFILLSAKDNRGRKGLVLCKLFSLVELLQMDHDVLQCVVIVSVQWGNVIYILDIRVHGTVYDEFRRMLSL